VNRFARSAIWIVVLAGAMMMAVPFLWMVVTSLKTDADAFAFPPSLVPRPPQWHNYADALSIAPFGRFFFNSAFISICVTCGSLLINSFAAFAFAKYPFRGRNVLFLAILATMMIPGQVTMIPSFPLLKHLAWLDTYVGLIVPGLASAFGLFVVALVLKLCICRRP
jgi:multiple sugar transport system permease protein